MPAITHFMVPADDMEQAKKFYTELFGWKISTSDSETAIFLK